MEITEKNVGAVGKALLYVFKGAPSPQVGAQRVLEVLNALSDGGKDPVGLTLLAKGVIDSAREDADDDNVPALSKALSECEGWSTVLATHFACRDEEECAKIKTR